MRKLISLFLVAALAACGGGAGDTGACSTCQTGSTIPVGSFSGTAFDGLIINGTVSVYDYTTGAKGALLGQATTDGLGLYSLALQVEGRPVLIEITGGYYVEEAGAGANISLTTNHKLTAVANYTTGSALKVAVTTYSHLAAGLAAFQISQGTPVATAINNANARASSLAGVNILTTTPKEITDITNASATLTPELKYGFLAGAISMWTYTHAPSLAVAHLTPYTSIDFAQLLYQDVAADGLLDGFGVDSTGAQAQLSFGSTLLGPNVYRNGLGTAMVQMAGHANNKTGLSGAGVLSYAQAFIASTDPLFNNVAPVPFPAQTAGVTSPAHNSWQHRTVSIAPFATSPFGLRSTEILVDGTSLSLVAGLPNAFTLNTTTLSEGAHTITITSVDLGGFTTSSSITLKVDNVSPTATASIPFVFTPGWMIATGSVTDVGAGLSSVTNTSTGATVSYTGNPTSYSLYNAIGSFLYTHTYQFRDAVGNCSLYSPSANGVYGGAWGVVSTGYVC